MCRCVCVSVSPVRTLTFESLETLLLVCGYILRTSRSGSHVKVIKPKSRSQAVGTAEDPADVFVSCKLLSTFKETVRVVLTSLEHIVLLYNFVTFRHGSSTIMTTSVCIAFVFTLDDEIIAFPPRFHCFTATNDRSVSKSKFKCDRDVVHFSTVQNPTMRRCMTIADSHHVRCRYLFVIFPEFLIIRR